MAETPKVKRKLSRRDFLVLTGVAGGLYFGVTLGVLNLYSSDVDAFDATEVALLALLAGQAPAVTLPQPQLVPREHLPAVMGRVCPAPCETGCNRNHIDKTINIRDPRQVVWAITSKVDPSRDVFILPESPFDRLDFATADVGLGGRMGIDATTKIYPETDRQWPATLDPDPQVAETVTQRWAEYGLADLQVGEVNPNLFGYDL